MVSDSRNPMMLEASPLPVHALAASHGVSIRAAWRTGQELWGTWRHLWVDTDLSRQGNEVLCGDPTLSNLLPSPLPAACCFSSLLPYQQLPFFYSYSTVWEGTLFVPGSFCLKQESLHACPIWKSLTKENSFPFKPPSFFVCFCHQTLWALELCLSSKLPFIPGILEKNVDESDLDLVTAPCPCCWFAGSLEQNGLSPHFACS